uniref:acetyl-CoA carboxylase biotin carboxyl carrier protein subunit n=1 Tax=Pelomonas sp. KK5 TaxID=1855730 RepID=UPI001E55BFB9
MNEIIKAPMTATLAQLAVRPGQALRAGDTLLVLEAMKMEHELRAPADAVVAEVFFAEGEA